MLLLLQCFLCIQLASPFISLENLKSWRAKQTQCMNSILLFFIFYNGLKKGHNKIEVFCSCLICWCDMIYVGITIVKPMIKAIRITLTKCCCILLSDTLMYFVFLIELEKKLTHFATNRSKVFFTRVWLQIWTNLKKKPMLEAKVAPEGQGWVSLGRVRAVELLNLLKKKVTLCC